MKTSSKKVKVGILGCGAIGSGIAKATTGELKKLCVLSGLYDINPRLSSSLAGKLKKKRLVQGSYLDLLAGCDLVVEAVNAKNARTLIRQAVLARKHVLVMSVGKMLSAHSLFRLAERSGTTILIPSGAIAGIDAIKSASLSRISKITLTTRKPSSGLRNTPYLEEIGIDLDRISQETVVFEGDVDTAIRYFPRNINVAATLALASRAKSKITIRILTSPEFTSNSHEIEVVGAFGRMTSRTDNRISPDNPKTSYLAVLSGIQTLKDFCSGCRIGT